MTLTIEEAMKKAQEYAGSTAVLEEVDVKDVAEMMYDSSRLDGCYVFSIIPSEMIVGGTEHIAVPKDGGEPFSLGIIGE